MDEIRFKFDHYIKSSIKIRPVNYVLLFLLLVSKTVFCTSVHDSGSNDQYDNDSQNKSFLLQISQRTTSEQIPFMQNFTLEKDISADTNRTRTEWVTELFAQSQNQFDHMIEYGHSEKNDGDKKDEKFIKFAPLIYHSNVNYQCRRDFYAYQRYLQNQTLWAVRMSESSQWPIVNVFGGTLDHLGSYEECLMVSFKQLYLNRSIDGQYCIAEATFNRKSIHKVEEKSLPADDIAKEDESVWDAIDLYEVNPVRLTRHTVRWALCVPSTCRPHDLDIALNTQLGALFAAHGLNISVHVDPVRCSVRKIPPRIESSDNIASSSENVTSMEQIMLKYQEIDVGDNLPSSYFYARTLLTVLIALVLIASGYELLGALKTTKDEKQLFQEKNVEIDQYTVKDSFNEKKQKDENKCGLVKLLMCFSAIRNWRQLMRYSRENDMAIIHWCKIFNLIFVIYGHRFIFFIGYPSHNTESIEERYKHSRLELIHTNVVDTFFMTSGFLTFYFGLSPMCKGGLIFLILNLVFRWIRMVPIFGLVMIFIVNIFPYLGEGPYWKERVLPEVHNCGTNWWTNFLVVGNLVNTDRQCLVISWYISTDIQLTLMGCLLLLMFCRWHRCGIWLSVASFVTAILITFGVAYYNHYNGVLRLYMSLLHEPRNVKEFTDFYIAFYNRAGPYLIGFFGGLILHMLRENNYNFTNKEKILYLGAAILIGEGSQFYGTLFYVYGREFVRVENAIYAALNRSLYVFPYAVGIVIYLNSGLGFFGKMLNRRFMVPLGRLTYSAFLVNTVIQLYHAASQKTVMPSFHNLYWFAAGDIIYTYICGFILFIFAECPLSNISKLLQSIIIDYFRRNEASTNDSSDMKNTKLPSMSGVSVANDTSNNESTHNVTILTIDGAYYSRKNNVNGNSGSSNCGIISDKV